MIFLFIAIGLALLSAILKPLADGLFDTSMWVAKVLAPGEIDDEEISERFLKVSQTALMEGWLSNVPFIASIFFFSSLVVSFFYHWWAPIMIFLLTTFIGVLLKLFFGRSVSYYLSLLHHKMANRVADYKRDSDFERLDAAASYCKDLEDLMVMYHNSHLRPPTPKQLKQIPFGDRYFWLDHSASGA
jgi:hypothetical protein